MPDDKDMHWAAPRDEDDAGQTAGGESGSEEQSWEAYRKWLRRGSEPKRNRGPLDPSLYTWKGYRNWAEQVKRNWTDRHQSESEDS